MKLKSPESNSFSRLRNASESARPRRDENGRERRRREGGSRRRGGGEEKEKESKSELGEMVKERWRESMGKGGKYKRDRGT